MSIFRICLDAGHGGKDPGAVNNELNLKEKDIALSIILELYHILKTKYNNIIDCICTRREDVFVELNDRCKAANNFGADLFFSIHLNSTTNKESYGCELLTYSTNSIFKEFEEELLQRIQEQLITRNRGVKHRPDLAVLNGTKMYAALLEVEFISNNEHIQRVMKKTKEIAEAIAKVFIETLPLPNKQPKESVINGIDKLYKIGVIKSPEYWYEHYKDVKYLEELFINISKSDKIIE